MNTRTRMNASNINTSSTKRTRMIVPSALSQCETWIESNPCPPNEDGAPRVAHWIYKAALAFKLRRLSTETAHPLIEKHMTREPRPGEIEQAIARAYEQESNGNSSRISEPKVVYDPVKLAHIANRIDFDITPERSSLIMTFGNLDDSPAVAFGAPCGGV
jgi:hypothetical protein